MVLGDLDEYMQKKEKKKEKKKLDHQLMPYTKLNSRWIKDLNISQNTIKILEEKERQENFSYPMQQYSDTSSRLRDIKERIKKWDYIELKSFCMAKEYINKMEREPTMWENIFANVS